jgi:hypothetical protein
MHLVNRQNRLSNSLGAKIRTAESEIASLTKELRATQGKLRKATTFENEKQNIPESVWKCPEFPEELALLVDDVVKNGSLQLGTKIRRALSIVCSYFASRRAGLENDLKREREAVEGLKTRTDEMIGHLKEVFPADLDMASVIRNDSV